MKKPVNIHKLAEFLHTHPDFKDYWNNQDPVLQGLYIELNEPTQSRKGLKVESQTFEMPDGSALVLDIDKDGKVWGIEIV